jgi:hypothetical protein
MRSLDSGVWRGEAEVRSAKSVWEFGQLGPHKLQIANFELEIVLGFNGSNSMEFDKVLNLEPIRTVISNQ